MYYFPSRQSAGSLLADQLMKYRYEDCAVVALSDGAVVVGAQIAARLHSPLNLLLTDAIKLQGEHDELAQIDHLGDITYNDKYSSAELDEMRSDNYSYIEQQKLEKVFQLNRLIGEGGVIETRLLKGRNIIVVSDGLTSGLMVRAASQYLKPISIHKLIMVTPFATVNAVDTMHVLADEIVCLNVLEDIISVDHYYDDNRMPSHEKIVRIIEDIILHWK